MIVVTGGTGLVGAHLLVKLLETNNSVTAIYRTENKISLTKRVFEYHNKLHLFSKIIWKKADILDINSLEIVFENATQIYHCAAFISFKPQHRDNLFKTNIEGTANVVNVALYKKIEKVCYVSSVAALGDSINNMPITEETDWNYNSLKNDYAISKHEAEMEVWRAYFEGLPMIIVNPGVIYGYGFTTGSSATFSSVYKGMPFYTIGNLPVVAVEDVVSIMVQLMNSNIVAERYTLVAENISVKNLLQTVALVLNAKEPKFYLNKFTTNILWRADAFFSFFGKKRVFSKSVSNSLHMKDLYSNEKIIKEMGVTFKSMKPYISQMAKENIKLFG